MKVQFQALADLLNRYVIAFRYAWHRRSEMEPKPRLSHEAQFLPAALSLQETPISPAPRVAMWMIIGFMFIALLWAIFGHVDVVATAQGKIVPNDRTKTIQSFETASVKAIHVTDGQRVKSGDLLIELDATSAHADTQRVIVEQTIALLQLARGQAFLESVQSGKNPRLERPEGVERSRYLDAQSLLAGQYAEYTARMSRVSADAARREAELRSTHELVRKLEQTLPIAQQRAEDFKNLVAQNFVSRHGYLEREQTRIEQEADLANQRSRLREIEAALREVQAQRHALIAETRRVTLDSINEARQRLDGLDQERKKADSRGRLMRLVSPVDGTVQQLAVHTIGGVVTEAQPLMLVVPSDNPLEVEAFFENKDIGFVESGQEAVVKIETFQFTKYGTLAGELSSISHDAISDERRGLIYSSRVRLSKTTMVVDGAEVSLSPGMAVTVEVRTGRRRVIEYFLAPLIQYGTESLRER